MNIQEQRCVLVVEDDIYMESIFKKIIHSIDPTLKVLWATSADEAQAVVQSRTPDSFKLIIADYHLKGPRTGYDFWRGCRHHFPSIAFAFVSSVTPEKYLKMMEYYQTCPKFIRKPFQSDQCRSILADLIKEERHVV